MAFKRPPPPNFEEEWQRLARRSAELRQEFAAFLDDCDRLLRQARFASLTHKEAVAEFLRERPDRVFGSREIQKALETEGLVFSSYYTVSAMLTRLQSDGRALQISHGRWTARPRPGSHEEASDEEASANGETDARQGNRLGPAPDNARE